MNKDPVNKDLPLKVMCRALYKEMGYCTHYEVRLRTKTYIEAFKSHDLSDIDVIGYSFSPDLSYSVIGAECKSGESHALDEIYKFMGIANYYGLHKAYFVKTKLHSNARNVAVSKGMSTYDAAELRQLLLGLSIDVDKQSKIETALYNRISSAHRHVASIDPKLHSYILFEYWNRDDWRNIHNLIHLLKNTNSYAKQNITLDLKYYHYLVLELFIRATLLVLHKAMNLSLSDLPNSLTVMLYGSADSLNERRQLSDLISQTIGKDERFEPSWQNSFLELCGRFSERPYQSSLMPKMIQDILDDGFFKDMLMIDGRIMKKYDDIVRKFTQDVIHFLKTSANINIDLFEEFLKT
jgi:hypothetical protein